MEGSQAFTVKLDARAADYARVLGGPPHTVTMRAGHVTLAPGASVGKHTTGAYEEAVVVFEGTGEMRSPEGPTLHLSPHTVAYCPPATEHDVVNTGAGPLRYLYLVARATAAEPAAPGEDPKLTALRLNERINARDLAGLADLLTDDHRFVDRKDRVVEGKPVALEAWRAFFAQFPGYRNFLARVESHGDLVAIAGHAVWSPGGAPDPALWSVRVAGGRIAEWRVWHDTPENRATLGLWSSSMIGHRDPPRSE